MGRKPKPTRIKVLEGNPGKRPLNKKEPNAPGIPKRPTSFNARCKKLWDEYVKNLAASGLVQLLDASTLELYVRTYDEYLTLDAYLKKNKSTYKTKGRDGVVMFRPRPEVGMRDRARTLLAKLTKEFGFSPSSRVPLGSTEQVADDDSMDKILENRWHRKRA